MKQNIKINILLLFLSFTFSLYSQTVLVSSKYRIERTCLGGNADKIERYSYHLQDQYSYFIQQKKENLLDEHFADFGEFISKSSKRLYGKRILNIIDNELSKKDKKRLSVNRRTIFITLFIDPKGKILLTELSYCGLLEKCVQPNHMYKILNEINKMTIEGIRPVTVNGYIKYTIARKFTKNQVI